MTKVFAVFVATVFLCFAPTEKVIYEQRKIGECYVYPYEVLSTQFWDFYQEVDNAIERVYRYLNKPISKRLSPYEVFEYCRALWEYKDSFYVVYFIANTAQETGFTRYCTSYAGAKGLNQVMPETFRWIAPEFKVSEITDVYANTVAGLRYWRYSLRRIRLARRTVSLEALCSAYNQGVEGHLYRKWAPRETRMHKRKVRFYYDRFLQHIEVCDE